ncbi:hypothetical protein C5167_011160 [Papaver somniferum]|uniref:TOD1/MUCI70 glycosyltransferase-like domain-containing protein n=1 Tax=Papaver somniferum TaxID=3469 RepID=A0A4Y7K549_PAPSO|nr:uncharacterized protein LOC113286278 [Papaver somniferum]RZC67472.1 hypothetical protein C5167_011160 [Papaver somniferum]
MRMKKTFTTPLLFQSKLVCFSLVYLFTTLFLALHSSLSSTKCMFRSSPFDPIQTPLFSYPTTYGEHKYAIPTVRSSCNSPVFFSDYWVVLKEIQDFMQNSFSSSSLPKYMSAGKGNSFGGNFSIQERMSYYNRVDDEVEVPCGFMKEFPVSNHDRIAMESCNGVVVVSAVFGDHDKIRQPKGLGSKTLETVCFFMFVDEHTYKGLNSHNLLTNTAEQEQNLGAWRIVRVFGELPYTNPAMNGVIPKHLVHRLFPNSKFSIWLDAKLQLMVDPLLLIHSLVITENVDMAISKHPYFIHTLEEAMATARWKKWWDIDSLKNQMETYCENGMKPWSHKKQPYPSDVPDTALILRKHGAANNLYSCLLFNELGAFNPRDQLAFAFVRDQMSLKLKMNMFEVEVFEQIAIEYRHTIKRVGGGSGQSKNVGLKTKMATSSLNLLPQNETNNRNGRKCEKYLLEIWGDFSHELN